MYRRGGAACIEGEGLLVLKGRGCLYRRGGAACIEGEGLLVSKGRGCLYRRGGAACIEGKYILRACIFTLFPIQYIYLQLSN